MTDMTPYQNLARLIMKKDKTPYDKAILTHLRQPDVVREEVNEFHQQAKIITETEANR